jgi:hypothetical protein
MVGKCENWMTSRSTRIQNRTERIKIRNTFEKLRKVRNGFNAPATFFKKLKFFYFTSSFCLIFGRKKVQSSEAALCKRVTSSCDPIQKERKRIDNCVLMFLIWSLFFLLFFASCFCTFLFMK